MALAAEKEAGKQGPVVETAQGRLLGEQVDGAQRFLGIPYAQGASGAGRFMRARPPQPWTGVRPALAYGPRAQQPVDPSSGLAWRSWIRDRQDMSEDCLVLNVFTRAAGLGEKRPVMFYIHGGGFNTGSGGVQGVEGSILASKAGVVVVTVNHRLNVFGHLYLGDAAPDAANNGMLDLVAALRWVRDNIPAFGGDPRNVTIFGQSGGGSKVAVLMSMAEAKGLFHKAIIQSASSLIRMATVEQAERCTKALLGELGLSRPDLAKLQQLPASVLIEARKKAVAAVGDHFRPVLDGRALSSHPFDPTAPAAALSVPLLIGTCEDELTFSLGPNPDNFKLTAEEAQRRIKLFVGTDDAGALQLMAAYRRTRPAATPSDLMIAIFSDHMYRRNDILAAERKAAQPGSAPAWMYLFTWKSPAVGGMLKTPHTLCIPFAFGTVDAARDMLGDGEDRYALSDRVMGAWTAFARHGDPNHPGLPAWPPYSAAARATMLFDRDCTVVEDPLHEDRIAISEYPLYTTDAGARRAG